VKHKNGEQQWWNNCGNTVWEDVKQMHITPHLGLKVVPNSYTNYRIPLNWEKVLDIGGGPSSLLLKCENVYGTVVDPCEYPSWVEERYKACDIEYVPIKGEDVNYKDEFDEVWVYNVLQHVEKPKKVIENALRAGKILRLFEWVNTGINKGHLHSFTKEQLEDWLGGKGKVTKLSEGGGAFLDTVIQGVTGYRCHTLNDFVACAQLVDNLDPKVIRKHAERYLTDNMQWELEDWMRELYQVYLSTTKGWHYVDNDII
jgi:hypothetical protein